MQKTVSFSVVLRVVSEDTTLLIQSAADRNPLITAQSSVLEALRELCLAPEVPPVDAGYALLNSTEVVATADPSKFRLNVQAHVLDEHRLTAAAKDAYQGAWQDQAWAPSSSAEALYEILLASNPNPAPVDLGFEIVQWQPAAA